MTECPDAADATRTGAARRHGGALYLAQNRRGLLFGILVAGACIAIAVLTERLPLAVLSLLVVSVMVALWQLHPRLGLIALWVTWLVIPGVRRVIDVVLPAGELDPLAVVPFVATATLGTLEVLRRPLPRSATRILAMAFAGLLLGMPLGVKAPTALTFGFLAYGAAIGAFALGYAERRRTRGEDSFETTLMVMMGPLALYGLSQYMFGLSVWDSRWMAGTGLISLGAPGDVGHYRVWSLLNSPATFAGVLAVALIFVIARRRAGALIVVASMLALAALALTYVRSALPPLAIGIIAIGFISRGRAAPRLLTVVAVMVVATLALGATTHAGSLVVDRISTFGSLNEDVSADARNSTLTALIPVILAAPMGHGVGSAGEPAKLASGEGFAVTDSGYLSVAYQLGPVGFALFVLAFVRAAAALMRARVRDPVLQERKEILAAGIVVLLVLAASADAFYGVLGAMLWYLLGQGVAIADAAREEASIGTDR